MKKEWLGYLAGIGSSVIMGLSWYATKRIGQIHEVSVLDILSVRYLISGFLFLLLWRIGRIHLDYRGKKLRPLLELSLLMPILYNMMEYKALDYISSAEIGMLCSLSTVVASLLGYMILGERISAAESLFMLMAVAGVIFVNAFDFIPGDDSNKGRLLMCGCVLCASVNRLKARRASLSFTSTEITAVMIWSSAVVLTALNLINHLRLGNGGDFILFVSDRRVYGYLLFLSLGCSLLGFLLNNVAIANLPMARSSVLGAIATVVAVASGAVLLREPLAWHDFVGCGLIVAGVSGCNLAKYREGEERSEDSSLPKKGG
ncbi:MAG: DMT family transporter [Lachnospiraceae bacterium]|nr:DMT family transporter [Lachnospiraceae bacterium]